MNRTLGFAALAAAAVLAAQGAIAGGTFLPAGAGQVDHDWLAEAAYEPCMNGGVSETGKFSSQLAEDKARLRMLVEQVELSS